jgi:hypothetical protein
MIEQDFERDRVSENRRGISSPRVETRGLLQLILGMFKKRPSSIRYDQPQGHRTSSLSSIQPSATMEQTPQRGQLPQPLSSNSMHFRDTGYGANNIAPTQTQSQTQGMLFPESMYPPSTYPEEYDRWKQRGLPRIDFNGWLNWIDETGYRIPRIRTCLHRCSVTPVILLGLIIMLFIILIMNSFIPILVNLVIVVIPIRQSSIAIYALMESRSIMTMNSVVDALKYWMLFCFLAVFRLTWIVDSDGYPTIIFKVIVVIVLWLFSDIFYHRVSMSYQSYYYPQQHQQPQQQQQQQQPRPQDRSQSGHQHEDHQQKYIFNTQYNDEMNQQFVNRDIHTPTTITGHSTSDGRQHSMSHAPSSRSLRRSIAAAATVPTASSASSVPIISSGRLSSIHQ